MKAKNPRTPTLANGTAPPSNDSTGKHQFHVMPENQETKRPINEPTRLSGFYDTMTQCSNARGIPLGVLKSARDSGCEAFRHGRVDLDLFIRWFFSRPTVEGEEILNLEQEQAMLAKEKRLALVEKREREEKETNFLTDVEKMIHEQLLNPLRAWLLSAPSALCTRLNPTQPELARQGLDDAIQKELFPLMRETLTREKTK